jgi:hypothetical protein
MMNTKDIFSLNLFAQYPGCLPAVDWLLATGDSPWFQNFLIAQKNDVKSYCRFIILARPLHGKD